MVDLIDSYIVIECDEDGDVLVRKMNREELLKKITPDPKYGDVEIDGTKVFKEFPKEGDPGYWRGNTLIIKGVVVAPRPVEVVTEFEI
jgi:hypothetical protein